MSILIPCSVPALPFPNPFLVSHLCPTPKSLSCFNPIAHDDLNLLPVLTMHFTSVPVCHPFINPTPGNVLPSLSLHYSTSYSIPTPQACGNRLWPQGSIRVCFPSVCTFFHVTVSLSPCLPPLYHCFSSTRYIPRNARPALKSPSPISCVCWS